LNRNKFCGRIFDIAIRNWEVRGGGVKENGRMREWDKVTVKHRWRQKSPEG